MKKEYICPPGKKSKVVIEDVTQEIKKDATLILGFAGIGLLGPIIGNTLVEQIEDLKEIGFITSEMLPPISTFYDGVLKHPFRLYYSQKYNVILGISEVPFQIPSAYSDLAKTICNWALSDDVKAKEIVLFQGIPARGMIEEFPVFYASESESIEEFEKAGITKVEKGIIVGPEATIINEALTNKLETLILFTPVYQIPTPEGAASLIGILNKKFKMNINTTALLEEGKEIKEKMLELAEKAQEFQRSQLSEGGKEGYSQYYQ
ncbi:MAG: proteasome assembly chaperone family protein [Candidatus Lokiarchaeota archaeon]|nr:proteasome assembly chaperone family protein [Candidatus Lokiarchaeota archaeon]